MEQRRSQRRARTRLRPGKLLSEAGRFLGDCAILDRSEAGARIRAFGGAALAGRMVLLEESERIRWPVRLVWSRDAEAGVQFAAAGESVGAAEWRQLTGRYYAVR